MRKGESMNEQLTLKQAIDKYQAYIDVYGTKGYAKFTQEQASALLAYFSADSELAGMNLNQAYNYIKAMQKKGLKNNTINKRLALLKRVIKHCGVNSNLNDLKLLRAQFVTYGRLSAQELKQIDKILPSLKLHEQLTYLVFKDTGVRVTELLHIKVANVRLGQRLIILEKTKTGQARSLYFTKTTANVLYRYFKAHEKDFSKSDALLFPSLKSNRERVNKLFKRIKTLSQVERVSPHRLRHTLASDLYARGCDLLYISKLLGHCNLDTTKRYILINDDLALSIYEKYVDQGDDE